MCRPAKQPLQCTINAGPITMLLKPYSGSPQRNERRSSSPFFFKVRTYRRLEICVFYYLSPETETVTEQGSG